MPVLATQPKHNYAGIIEPPLDDEWSPFPEESGTLKIPRSSMPQIKSEHRGAMTRFLKARGITHQVEEVLPSSLKPTQAEYSPAKVAGARNFDGPQRSILISADDHLLDGHHQWLSSLDAPDEPIPAIRLNAPIQTLLLEASQFPSSYTNRSSATQETPAQPKHNYEGIVEPIGGASTAPPTPAPRHNYEGIVEPPVGPKHDYEGARESVTSTFRDDVDFDKPYQPAPEFSPLLGAPLTPESLDVGKMISENLQLYPDAAPEPATLDLGQKIAHYFHTRARPDLPEPPRGYGREQGKSVTVRVRSPKSGYPLAEEVDAAVLEAMGGRSYVESGRRFKAQAGEPLGLAQFNVAEAYQRGEAGYDDKARAYVFNVAPNQRFIAALNTWLKTGSVDAVRAVDRQIAAATRSLTGSTRRRCVKLRPSAASWTLSGPGWMRRRRKLVKHCITSRRSGAALSSVLFKSATVQRCKGWLTRTARLKRW